LRKLSKEGDRLVRGDEEYQKGNIAVASRLYAGLASSRTPSQYSKAARERLGTLRDRGRKQCDEIDDRLSELVKRMNSVSDPEGEPVTDDEVRRVFDDYKQLLNEYHQVAQFGPWLTRHVTQQKARPECAASLNEPKAAELWRLGQTHEENGHGCCAYRAYEKAEKLLPAESAKLAQERLKKLKEDDPAIIEAAKACAELEWCHRTYQRAEKLLENNSERAGELFAEVVERSPEDSEVHRVAAEKLKDLKLPSSD
jgi:tetratricopeptide (TPR) repeat protein